MPFQLPSLLHSGPVSGASPATPLVPPGGGSRAELPPLFFSQQKWVPLAPPLGRIQAALCKLHSGPLRIWLSSSGPVFPGSSFLLLLLAPLPETMRQTYVMGFQGRLKGPFCGPVLQPGTCHCWPRTESLGHAVPSRTTCPTPCLLKLGWRPW